MVQTFDLQKGSYTLEYDSLDRLIKAKTWFTQGTYTYDSEHRRILENSTPILWDGQHEMGESSFYRILGRTAFAEMSASKLPKLTDHNWPHIFNIRALTIDQ